jgi:hypothetical protein
MDNYGHLILAVENWSWPLGLDDDAWRGETIPPGYSAEVKKPE